MPTEGVPCKVVPERAVGGRAGRAHLAAAVVDGEALDDDLAARVVRADQVLGLPRACARKSSNQSRTAGAGCRREGCSQEWPLSGTARSRCATTPTTAAPQSVKQNARTHLLHAPGVASKQE